VVVVGLTSRFHVSDIFPVLRFFNWL